MRTAQEGLDAGELGEPRLRAEDVIDFSSNIDALRGSQLVCQAGCGAKLSAYPDRGLLGLRETLSRRPGVGADHPLVGSGPSELIHLLARARLREGAACSILEPTFGEHEAAADLAGGIIRVIAARGPDACEQSVSAQRQVLGR